MYQLKYALIGKSSGDFRPKFKQPEQAYFLERLEYQLNERNINGMFSPHCQMTTNVAQMGTGEEKSITPWLIRTPPGFDGGMVTEPDTAVCIFNADCPVIILFDEVRGRLVLLHAGFRCLVPKNQNTPSIVSSAFQNFNLDPSELEAFVGFGAGPCCYGIDHHLNQELDSPKLRPYLWRTEKGPRSGQIGLNLLNMARHQLRLHGLLESAIYVNLRCTACAGRENGKGDYHSNIYEGKDSGRNLALAWFTAK